MFMKLKVKKYISHFFNFYLDFLNPIDYIIIYLEKLKKLQKKLEEFVMAFDSVLEINDDNFEAEVIKSDKLTLVDFWAPWCGPCKIIGPVLDELAGEYEGKVKFTKLNVDDNPSSASNYGVRGIPTMILFKDGEAQNQIVGAVPKSELEKAIKESL